MISEKGFSWTESILALAILMVVFGTLLPLYSHMSARLEGKRLKMHAAETAYQGAILYQAYGMMDGENTVEQVLYRWSVDVQAVCVSYRNVEKDEMLCIDY